MPTLSERIVSMNMVRLGVSSSGGEEVMMVLRREVKAVPLSPWEVDELSIAAIWDWTSGDAICEEGKMAAG